MKTQTRREFGLPDEAVTMTKLRSIERVGQIYRAVNKDLPAAERIDVVVIERAEDGKIVHKVIIKNASAHLN